MSTDIDDWSFWMPTDDEIEEPSAPTKRAELKTPVVSTRRVAYSGERDWRYVGLVRLGRGGKVLVECGHEHRNRGQGGDSATDCAASIIQGARLPSAADYVAEQRRNRWQRLTRGFFTVPAATIAAAKASAAADSKRYLDTVETVRRELP